MILDRIATQESKENYYIGIGVEDDAAIDGDLEDMLVALPVKFALGCHFSIVLRLIIRVYHSELT